MTSSLRERLMEWYGSNARKLPWRENKDPYFVWVSEVILQQTRVNQGMDYFLRFITKFPALEDLATAPPEEVLRIWQGLGYYSRARNMHEAAADICKLYNGKMPGTYEELRSLKGIGDYTASAIASICFNVPIAVIDGNVKRVISRLYGIAIPPDTSSGLKAIREKLDDLLDRDDPGTFNQAMMEFGALVCTPMKPACDKCIFNNKCEAAKSDPTLFPVKSKKILRKARFFHYLCFRFSYHDTSSTVLRRRLGNDIWKHLYDFPAIETKEFLSSENLVSHPEFSEMLEGREYELVAAGKIKHVLTHQDIHASFYKIQVKDPLPWMMQQPYSIAGLHELGQFPMPRLIGKYLAS